MNKFRIKNSQNKFQKTKNKQNYLLYQISLNLIIKRK